MDRDAIVGLILIFGLIAALIFVIVYIAYSLHVRETAPDKVYCKKTIPIIYVNQTALTDNDRCFDYLLEENYEFLGKNGSYYILEPKK